MPTYEYACKQCGQHLDVVQSFTDDPLTVCLHCGGELRKVFGSVGIVFKGSGFYKNDSRPASKGSKGSEPAAASTSDSSSGDSSSTTTPAKSDKAGSKPAPAKAEPKPAAAAS